MRCRLEERFQREADRDHAVFPLSQRKAHYRREQVLPLPAIRPRPVARRGHWRSADPGNSINCLRGWSVMYFDMPHRPLTLPDVHLPGEDFTLIGEDRRVPFLFSNLLDTAAKVFQRVRE